MMSVWDPKILHDNRGGAVSIGDPTRYEYGPTTSVEIHHGSPITRLWCCAGRNTDTISSIRLDGTGAEGWTLPGKLVADPAVMRYGNQFLLLYTVGDLDGTRNGLGYHWIPAESPRVHGGHVMLIAQKYGPVSNPYGIGQPCVAARPYSPTILIYTSTLSGVNRLQAGKLDVGKGGVSVSYPIPIVGGDDGASVDAFWMSPTRLCVIQSDGNQYLGTRTYTLLGTKLLRDIGEKSYDGFWCQTVVKVPNVVDGVGLVKGLDAQPVLDKGRIVVWVSVGDHTSPGTWQLRRVAVPMPK